MKKIKLIAIITMLVMVVALAAGCSSKDADEFVDYINETCSDLDKDSQEVSDMYTEVSRSSSADEQLALLEEIIPKSEALIAKAKAVEIEGEDLQRIHQVYVDHLEFRHKAYENAYKGIEESNNEYISEANLAISDADLKYEEYIESRKKLAEKLEVEITEK